MMVAALQRRRSAEHWLHGMHEGEFYAGDDRHP